MLKSLTKFTGKIDEVIDRICTWGLFISLGVMIALTLLNIVLRWFSTTVLWVEPLVRQLVFLAAFLGGIIATGSRSHIAIDLVSRLLEALDKPKLKNVIDRLIIIFCLISVIWLAYAGYSFMLIEAEYGRIEFLGIHSSVFVGIIPVGLLVIAFRFLHHFLCSWTVKPEPAAK